MKTGSLVAAGFIILLGVAFTAQGQDKEAPVIKVLPASQSDAVKLLVTQNSGNDVQVSFHTEQGSIADDRISGKRAGDGFLKRYSFEKLDEQAFWMTIRTETTSSLYKITRNGEKVDARLEEITHTFPVVASR
jgi:hypothetical protein